MKHHVRYVCPTKTLKSCYFRPDQPLDWIIFLRRESRSTSIWTVSHLPFLLWAEAWKHAVGESTIFQRKESRSASIWTVCPLPFLFWAHIWKYTGGENELFSYERRLGQHWYERFVLFLSSYLCQSSELATYRLHTLCWPFTWNSISLCSYFLLCHCQPFPTSHKAFFVIHQDVISFQKMGLICLIHIVFFSQLSPGLVWKPSQTWLLTN